MRGGEVYANWSRDDLFIKSSYNYVKAINDETDQNYQDVLVKALL